MRNNEITEKNIETKKENDRGKKTTTTQQTYPPKRGFTDTGNSVATNNTLKIGDDCV